MKDMILCDLDGTLADCSHRRHHVENKPKNWDAFYAGVGDDAVHEPVAEVLHRMAAEPLYYKVLFITGRPERCRADTVRWLETNTLLWTADYSLYMRKDGDKRADYIVKQEILDAHIDKDRVLFVLDDRQQVVDMWRRNGLVCFQVAPGDF